MKKKCLYITAFPPNQKTGGQFFSLNAIKELSKEYLIDLYYFNYSDHNSEVGPSENVNSVNELRISNSDFIKRFYRHPIFTRRINKKYINFFRKIASSYDILYFDFTQVALYSLYIKHPYKVLRVHDVLVQKFERKNQLLGLWISKTEKKVLSSFNKVFVPSAKDVDIIEKKYGIISFYTNEYLKPVALPDNTKQVNQFVFYGYWKRPENTEGLIWFMENVFPKLKNSYNFIVIGGGLETTILNQYLKPNRIEYLGFVDLPLEIILKSVAVIVPLFQGAGIKVKVIDSFTVGTPVIGTELAFEGLPEISGLKFQADDAIKMAEIIDNFSALTFEEKREKMELFYSVYDKHHLLEQI